MRFNQATVPSDNVDESVEFYRKLGLIQIVGGSSDYARFTFPGNDATFSVHRRGQDDASDSVVIYFECDNLDETVVGLKARGIQVDSEPVDQRWLWREARLRDPDGNLLCLFHAGENRLDPPWKMKSEAQPVPAEQRVRFELQGAALRPWRVGDEESLVRHANNPKIFRNVRDRFPNPYTMEDAHWWTRHAGSKSPVVDFAIECDGHAVGGIGLMLQEDVNRISAEIGYWLGEEFWGRGIVSEGVGVITRYGLEGLGLTRIYAMVFEWNQPSMRVLEKAGYKFEGCLKKAAIKENQVIDEYLYGITR